MRVVDDGNGVPKDRENLLFKRGATFGKEGGTGLGLAYAKQVTMGHGGDIRYYRKDSRTIFECFIPNALEGKSTDPEVEKTVEPDTKETTHKKVGLVFKSASLCSQILDILKKLNVESISWHEGFTQGYDFIITDDPSIVDTCIDEGISVAQFKPDTSVDDIVRRTLIRLGISQNDRKGNPICQQVLRHKFRYFSEVRVAERGVADVRFIEGEEARKYWKF